VRYFAPLQRRRWAQWNTERGYEWTNRSYQL